MLADQEIDISAAGPTWLTPLHFGYPGRHWAMARLLLPCGCGV